MKIGINCGHTVNGQPGSGAVGFLNESDETRNVGYKLIELLRAEGHTVVDCTNDYAESTNANLNEIVRLANSQPLDLFVSIHFNSGGGKGCEVFTYGAAKHTEAVSVCDKLHELGFENRGIKDGSRLAVVRRSDAKALLIEVCFVDSEADLQLYQKLGADKIAQAIYSGITGKEIEERMDMEEFKNLTDRVKALENKLNEPKMIYNYIDDNMPQWAHEAVQWCVDNGIIQGTGEGLGLDDTKLWLCVVMYRLAMLLEK